MKVLLMFIALLLLSVFLTGCSAIPSVKYCDRVIYDRQGQNVTIYAECVNPSGGLGL